MAVQPVDDGDVAVTVDGPVVVVTLNRPAKRNALTQAMYATVADTLRAADADRAVAAVVLTGAGGAFTAGNDLADFEPGATLVETVRFFEAITSVSVPLVAAVSGVAVGVGFTMLLHCDFVYAEPDAVLRAPFTELGLVPEAGSSLLLPRVVGPRHAAEVLLAGRTVSGAEAAAWGLATEAVSPALDTALACARALGQLPPGSLRTTKELLRADDTGLADRMRREMTLFAEALSGPEFAAVMAARSARRPR